MPLTELLPNMTLNCENENKARLDTALLHRDTLKHFDDKAYHMFYRRLLHYCETYEVTPKQAYDNVVEYHQWVKKNDIPLEQTWWF